MRSHAENPAALLAEERAYRSGIKHILSLLADTVVRLANPSEGLAKELRSTLNEVDDACDRAEFAAIHSKLAELLPRLRVPEAPQAPKPGQVGKPDFSRAAHPITDPITGLPMEAQARQRIHAAIPGTGRTFIALFVVERLDLINSRFGFAAGDRVLALVSQHISQQLLADDQLFRWRGPTMLAIFDRKDTLKVVDAEVRRISTSRLEYSITTRERDALLRILCSSCLIPITPESVAEDLFEHIDAFSASRGTALN